MITPRQTRGVVVQIDQNRPETALGAVPDDRRTHGAWDREREPCLELVVGADDQSNRPSSSAFTFRPKAIEGSPAEAPPHVHHRGDH